MALMNSETGWGIVSRLLHWGMAGVVLFMAGLGVYMTNAFPPGDLASFEWFQLHKSWGAVAFLLIALRAVWRLLNRTSPALPPSMSPMEVFAAKAVHVAFYVLLFVLPISGWIMVTASPLQDLGVANQVFGLFEMPDPFVPGNREIEGAAKTVHMVSAIALFVVFLLHVGGAALHGLVRRDGIFSRMVTGRG